MRPIQHQIPNETAEVISLAERRPVSLADAAQASGSASPAPEGGIASKLRHLQPKADAQAGRKAHMNDMDRAYVDSRLEAAQERMNAKLASIEADVKTMVLSAVSIREDIRDLKEDIRHQANASSNVKFFIIGTGIALAALMIALFALGIQAADFVRSILESAAST